jgi:cytochrome b561
MGVRNTDIAWGWPAKALHWLAALIILLLLGHGWWMTHIAPRPDRLAHYAGHSALGFDLLVLMVLRLLWRWLNPVPADPVDAKAWERWAAHAAHIGLYVLIFVVSLTGWVTANTFRTPITRDVFNIPFPIIAGGIDRSTRNLFEESHMVLAYVLGVLVLVHVLAALRHHLSKRNDVLRRMTWGMRGV